MLRTDKPALRRGARLRCRIVDGSGLSHRPRHYRHKHFPQMTGTAIGLRHHLRLGRPSP